MSFRWLVAVLLFVAANRTIADEPFPAGGLGVSLLGPTGETDAKVY